MSDVLTQLPIKDSIESAGKSPSTEIETALVGESSDTIPALVIGDVHGHLDRLEALLEQEGLLENGQRTDRPAQIVLVGDVGHFGHGGSPTGDELTWKAAAEWADVILWGNHDRAIVEPWHQFNGYQAPRGPVIFHIIKALRAEGRIKLAHVAHDFLITHAGLAAAFIGQKVKDERVKEDPYLFADWINQVEDPDVPLPEERSLIAVRDAIGPRRGGMSNVGGILWRDIQESLYPKFRQVFGHSAGKKHQVQYCTPKAHTGDPETALNFKHPISYCIDIGGKGGKKGDNCLGGIWLPTERIVRIDL